MMLRPNQNLVPQWMKCWIAILVVCLGCTGLGAGGVARAADGSNFAGGSGTAADPYLIANKEQLYWISANWADDPSLLSSHYRLTANIDFAGWDWHAKPWLPIGNDDDYPEMPNLFRGTFNGDGHVITGLAITGEDNLGMFGAIAETAVIRNVILEQLEVSGWNYVGGLAALNYGTIQSSRVSGIIEGLTIVGGLVGYNDGVVTTSHSAGTVSGNGGLGGAVGYNTRSVLYVSTSADVEGTGAQSGGLVGLHYGVVQEAYATGIVRGASAIGGLVGQTQSGSQIKNAYATGQVSFSAPGGSDRGALVGVHKNGASIVDAFWNQELSPGIADIGKDEGTTENVTGLSNAQMKMMSSYPTFDFAQTWSINEGTGTPYLKPVIVRTEDLLPAEAWAGTAFADLPLPGAARAYLSNQQDVMLPVTWNAAGYDAIVPGTYLLSGQLGTGGGVISAHSDVNISVPVIVKPLGSSANLSAAAGSGRAELSWAAVPGASRYAVYYTDDAVPSADPADWLLIDDQITEQSYTVAGLQNDAEHWLAVQALNNGAAGDLTMAKVVLLNDNAKLTEIRIDGKVIDGFHPDTGSYTVHVGYATAEVTVTAAVYDPQASYLITGGGQIGETRKLVVGNNYIDIIVTAANGEDTSTYTLNIKRASSGAGSGGGGGGGDDEDADPPGDQVPKTDEPGKDDGDGESEKEETDEADQDTSSDEREQAPPFSDVAGHWAFAHIQRAVDLGIVAGYPDGTFKPDAAVSRAEFTMMLYKLLGLDDAETVVFTDDAHIGDWARQAIAAAVKAGIISGYEDGSFRPANAVTRAEMAVMVARALGLTQGADAAPGFADNGEIPDWAQGAVAALREFGIVSGRGDNRFAPQATLNRAEAVVVLLAILDYQTRE